MSHLTYFYRQRTADEAGRYLRDIWRWDDDKLEETHDFIQWLFPLPEPSRYNPAAPLLSDEDCREFTIDPLLRENLRQSYLRILGFLGLMTTQNGAVVEGSNFSARVPDVWSFPNHNWLRIMRILRCLTLLGFETEAKSLFAYLSDLHSRRRFPIADATFRYWSDALAVARSAAKSP